MQVVSMESIDAHSHRRRLELYMKKLDEIEIEHNRKLIIDFYNDCMARGLSVSRILKYMYSLLNVSKWLSKDFEDASKEDIVRLVGRIESNSYSEYTKNDYRITIKRFWKWLNGDEDYPNEVKWIPTTIRNCREKLPEELISEEDVKKMIKSADNCRDRALISVLYESGCRIGEILSLRIKHVSFDDIGARMMVNGKTGMRRVRIVASVPFLASWMENHPLKDNPDAPLWTGMGTRNKYRAVKYESIRSMLQRVARRAGVKKRVNPHMFRHSRATHLANHLTEAQMNHYFGWVQGSDMPSTYVHLSGRDVDDAILTLYGLKRNKEKDGQEFAPVRCPRCNTMNSPGGRLCIRCGMPLDVPAVIMVEEKRKKMDELMSALLRDPEVRSVVRRKMMEMRLSA